MTAFLAPASSPALQLLARRSAGGSALQSAASREGAFPMGDRGCTDIWTAQSVLLWLLQTAAVADTMTQKRWSWPEEGRRCRHARHTCLPLSNRICVYICELAAKWFTLTFQLARWNLLSEYDTKISDHSPVSSPQCRCPMTRPCGLCTWSWMLHLTWEKHVC